MPATCLQLLEALGRRCGGGSVIVPQPTLRDYRLTARIAMPQTTVGVSSPPAPPKTARIAVRRSRHGVLRHVLGVRGHERLWPRLAQNGCFNAAELYANRVSSRLATVW